MPIPYNLGFDNFQMQLDYDVRTDDNPIYQGYAAPDVATSTNGWTIYKYTIDASNRVTIRKIAMKVAWDLMATLTYS